jgi:di/tricarboxylate transporter
MFGILPSIETLKAVVTLLILLAAVYSFVREKLSPDLTALLAMCALLITGILTPWEAFSGFSHPATISVAAVLVLSAAIERTGLLSLIARRVLAPLGKSEFTLIVAIMSSIGVISAFINNTAAVAIFIPVVLEVCRRIGASPSRMLMPMSFAATMGGMCTLIGTSTNLVAHEFARSRGLDGFSMFELAKVGLPMLFAGISYMLFVGRRFLPDNQSDERLGLGDDGDYLVELLVQPDSPWIGREVSAANFHRDFDVELAGLVRNDQMVNVDKSGSHYLAGDSLRVRGPLDRVLALAAREGLELHRPENRNGRTAATASRLSTAFDASQATAEASSIIKGTSIPEPKELPLAEVVVLTPSGLIGRTLKNARFAERFDTVVLALRRRGDLRDRPSTTPLRAGDVLLVEGEENSLRALAETPGFLVIGTPALPEQRPGKLAITLLTLIAVVAVVSFGLAPIVTAATAGCAVLLLIGCLRLREAYQAIDMSLIFLLAGSLALGAALEKTGITGLLARSLTGLSGVTGPFIVLVGFFIVSVIVSELMSNSGTVALLGPMALSTAAQMDINPMSLLAAVTFGASAAFAMPIGYQTSMMIYGPGGYRFKDFIRMGLVLDLILAILALWLIPHFWPLILR